MAAACTAAAILLSACGSTQPTITFSSSTTPSTPTGTTGTDTTPVPIDTLIGPQGIDYEANPALVSPGSDQTGLAIDGVQCQTLRQLAFRANSHLQVYVDGQPRALPGGVGMVQPSLSETSAGPVFSATTCYYWLHTVTQDGVIQAESPVSRRFDLGQFFAVWGQPLTADRVANAHGHVIALVDGKRWHGSLRRIPLTEHTVIQLDVGTPAPAFKPVDWATSDL